jgi:CubicO group peptidase (beta-lactamase class C family)
MERAFISSQRKLSMHIISPEKAGFSSSRLERLDAAVQRYVDEGKVAGLVTLLSRRGQIFHAGCHGMADRERNRPMFTNSLFRLWSVTKALTYQAMEE